LHGLPDGTERPGALLEKPTGRGAASGDGMAPLIVFELQAALGPLVGKVEGLGVDDGCVDTAELHAFGACELLVACYRKGEKATHVVGHASGVRRHRELDGLGELLELRRIEELMVAAQVFPEWLGISHLDFPPEGGPTFGEVGRWTGHFEVVDIDDEDELQFGMEEAAGPVLDEAPVALPCRRVELLLPVPSRVGVTIEGKTEAARGVLEPRLTQSEGQR